MIKRITQKKGDIAVTKAICYFTSNGFDVSLPVTESAPYDIVVDDGINLKKVQVRYTSSSEVDLRRIHSNSNGYVVKKTEPKSYDWLFVVTTEGEYILRKCLNDRRSVSISSMEKLI